MPRQRTGQRPRSFSQQEWAKTAASIRRRYPATTYSVDQLRAATTRDVLDDLIESIARVSSRHGPLPRRRSHSQ